jgi:LuxR family maltose regulon positive regulatory protein
VSRSRLLERLNAGTRSGRKLTLISAPAGFGKTTLVSEWVADLRSGAIDGACPSIAWLSLDESDNDLTRFLTYLIGALQTIQTDIGKGALSALQSPQPPPTETILTALINEIAALACRIVLVLDDYHLIDTQSIHDAFAFLLRRLPPQMHMFIATREDPPLPVARLRVRGQLTELRATDMRFSSSEAAEFLNQVMGLGLAADDIAALEARTEGWIAGLQLAAISMRDLDDATSFIQSFTGSNRLVLDYLIEEVLNQQSADVQDFLLQTAILDRMTGSLCDVLTSQESSQETLETLDRANLFVVPLDKERRWYRYHHLFADLLCRRLRLSQPDHLKTLQRRASKWYEENGFTDEAIEHALHAGDYERTTRLIGEHGDTIWQRGEHARLQRWLTQVPTELLFSKPDLCILYAWNLFASGQQDAAEQSLQAAERALGTSTDLTTSVLPMERDQSPDSDRKRIRGRVATIRAFLAGYRGDVQEINKYASQALECLPEQDLSWRSAATVSLGDAYSFSGNVAAAYRVRVEALAASKAVGNIYMILIAGLKLAATLRAQGRLERVIEVCQQQVQLAQKVGMSHVEAAGCLLAIWGEVLAEQDHLDGALEQASKGTELAERGKDVMVIGWSHVCLVRVLFSRGDLSGAQEIVQRTGDIARAYHMPPWITNLMAAWQARIWLAQDMLDAASLWVGECELDTESDPTYMSEKEYMALARILIAQGRLDEATTLLQRLLEATETGGRTSRAIEVLLLQALAFQAKGDTDQVITALGQALTLAEPGGFVRIFVDEGPPMAHLLYEALARGIAPDYVHRLLAAFPSIEPEKAAPSTKNLQSDLIEPLSEREIQVLELIAEGLTNQEIASRLFLSQHTIKAHTRNIYGKLDVHSRTEAVARCRALGILSSS